MIFGHDVWDEQQTPISTVLWLEKAERNKNKKNLKQYRILGTRIGWELLNRNYNYR